MSGPHHFFPFLRKKKSSVASRRAVRPAKRKTICRITETSSDEENSRMLAPPPPSVLTQQSKTTRSGHLKTTKQQHITKMTTHVESFGVLLNITTTVNVSGGLTFLAN